MRLGENKTQKKERQTRGKKYTKRRNQSLEGTPPATTNVSPVMYEASSEAKYAAAAAMSCVVPSLPSSVLSSRAFL